MVRVSEEEKNIILAKLRDLIERKKELSKTKIYTGATFISMNKNLHSTTKTYRKTQKTLQKV